MPKRKKGGSKKAPYHKGSLRSRTGQLLGNNFYDSSTESSGGLKSRKHLTLTEEALNTSRSSVDFDRPLRFSQIHFVSASLFASGQNDEKTSGNSSDLKSSKSTLEGHAGSKINNGLGHSDITSPGFIIDLSRDQTLKQSLHEAPFKPTPDSETISNRFPSPLSNAHTTQAVSVSSNNYPARRRSINRNEAEMFEESQSSSEYISTCGEFQSFDISGTPKSVEGFEQHNLGLRGTSSQLNESRVPKNENKISTVHEDPISIQRICASPTTSISSEEIILFEGRNKGSRSRSKAVKIPCLPSDDPLRSEGPGDEVLASETRSSPRRMTTSRKARIRHHSQATGQNKTNFTEQEALFADYIANIDPELVIVEGHVHNLKIRDFGAEENKPCSESVGVSASELPSGLSTTDKGLHSARRRPHKEKQHKRTYSPAPNDVQSPDITGKDLRSAYRSSTHASTYVHNSEVKRNFFDESNSELNLEDIEDEKATSSTDCESVQRNEGEKEFSEYQSKSTTDEGSSDCPSDQLPLVLRPEKLFLDDEISAMFTNGDLWRTVITPKNHGLLGACTKTGFPPADDISDEYTEFDIMDYDRPSLRPKRKGRKGRLLPHAVSDSELEESMQAASASDRIRKKEKKKDREQLRALGLLGVKHGKVNMMQKYKEGIRISDVKEEIKRFLISSHTTLALPPMDKSHRKTVHEIANIFKLKSKSVGGGVTRQPILYRTARTSAYSEHNWNRVEDHINKRYMPRNDVGTKSYVKPKWGNKISKLGQGNGFNRLAVSYRDGDVVGGSAPELAADNRGRAMLEKMGWSQGTALGALNNKGILQPVVHIVKTTKAGLG